MTQFSREPAMSAIPGGMEGFEAAFSKRFFPYQINSVRSPETFGSAAASRDMGCMKLFRTHVGNSYAGGRLAANRSNERNTYILVLVEIGLTHFQGRRNAIAKPGELILLNSDHALDTYRELPGQSLAVSIPASMVRLRCAEVDDWCLIPLPTIEGSPAILRDCLLTYWRTQSEMTEPGYTDLAAALIHLIGACFRQRSGNTRIGSRSMQTHFMQIRGVVDAHLTDPELSVDMVAERLGSSKSYVFMVMRAANTTLGKFIRDQRLERSAQMLADPAMISRTITEIAFALGFQNLAHFSRRFTEKFGLSPRAYRIRRQSPLTTPASC